jgi:hypothetical protein
MTDFFSRSSRFLGMTTRRGDPLVGYEDEYQFNGTFDDLIESSWTWASFFEFAHGKKLWTSPDVWIETYTTANQHDIHTLHNGYDIVFCMKIEAIGEGGHHLEVYSTSSALACSTVEGLCRMILVTTNILSEVSLKGSYEELHGQVRPFCMSAEALTGFLAAASQKIEKLCIQCAILAEDHCQALAASSMPLYLENCVLHDTNNAFQEALRENRGPSSLHISGTMVLSTIAGYLRPRPLGGALSLAGNTSLKILSIMMYRSEAQYWLEEGGIDALIHDLTLNRGLVKLELTDIPFDDVKWTMLCQSLRNHPTLETLAFHVCRLGPAGQMSNGSKIQRTRDVVTMLKHNTVLRDIIQPCWDQRICENEVVPRLRLNRFRSHIATTPGISGALLSRALYTFREEPELLWELLSVNRDTALQGVVARQEQQLQEQELEEQELQEQD